jgi:hypothetical protein
MGIQNNIWSQLSRGLFVVKYTSIDELKKYREAIKAVNMNIHDCTILAIVDTKKEKNTLGEQSNVVFVSEQEFNLFGVLKNEEAKNTVNRAYDVVLYTVDVPKRIGKLLNKTKKKLSVGVNCTSLAQNVNLKTEVNSPEHLINFAKQTLEKIT